MLTIYSEPDHIADIISVLFFVLITALLFLKCASAPLVLSLVTEIKLDLNSGVYNAFIEGDRFPLSIDIYLEFNTPFSHNIEC